MGMRIYLTAVSMMVDEKTLTAVSTTLALFQIQLNALLLLLERQASPQIREDFQRLVNEGVQAVGMETMESIKNRIRETILQQDTGESGLFGNG